MTVQLLVVQGKEKGKTLTFPDGEFVFGRGEECHVRPNSELVSRQHCLLEVAPRKAMIRDLGSTNGTLVNGKRVRGEQVLCDGDRLQLGPVVLLVQFPRDPGFDTVPDTAMYQRDTLKESPCPNSPGSSTVDKDISEDIASAQRTLRQEPPQASNPDEDLVPVHPQAHKPKH